MKTISDSLKAHLAQEVTTLATCWKLTRQDATVLGFTDHNEPITFETVVYEAATGSIPTGLKASSDMSVPNMDIVSIFDSAAITSADLEAGLYDYASVEMFIVNYEDLTMGAMYLPGGSIGQVIRHRTQFEAEIRGLMQSLQQKIGRIMTPTCDADLGDSRCTVSLAGITDTGSVTSVVGRRKFYDSARTEANNYYTFGKLTWVTGLNAGLSMEVRQYLLTDLSFELAQPMPYDIQAGDTYEVYKGCNKIKGDASNGCLSFSNVINFQGFDDIPGADALYQYPDAH